MIKVIYYEGPDRVNCGIAGELIRGVPKELEDDIAECLLTDEAYQIYKEEVEKNVTSNGK